MAEYSVPWVHRDPKSGRTIDESARATRWHGRGHRFDPDQVHQQPHQYQVVTGTKRQPPTVSRVRKGAEILHFHRQHHLKNFRVRIPIRRKYSRYSFCAEGRFLPGNRHRSRNGRDEHCSLPAVEAREPSWNRSRYVMDLDQWEDCQQSFNTSRNNSRLSGKETTSGRSELKA